MMKFWLRLQWWSNLDSDSKTKKPKNKNWTWLECSMWRWLLSNKINVWWCNMIMLTFLHLLDIEKNLNVYEYVGNCHNFLLNIFVLVCSTLYHFRYNQICINFAWYWCVKFFEKLVSDNQIQMVRKHNVSLHSLVTKHKKPLIFRFISNIITNFWSSTRLLVLLMRFVGQIVWFA